MDMEGEEIKKLTTELGNTVIRYNQNVEKLWDILTSFQPSAKDTLGKHESIKSMDKAFEFYKT